MNVASVGTWLCSMCGSKERWDVKRVSITLTHTPRELTRYVCLDCADKLCDAIDVTTDEFDWLTEDNGPVSV